MPNQDRTGPSGKGPKTGRRLGKCHKSISEQESKNQSSEGLHKHLHSSGMKGKMKRGRNSNINQN
jgi:hypothetical protein